MTRVTTRLRHLDQNLRTGEVRHDPLAFAWHERTETLRLSYEDPTDNDWWYGVLWLRHGTDMTGRHLWKAVNTPRTLAMMTRHLCMVCSASCMRNDRRIWWLLVGDSSHAPDGTPITNLPPVCEGHISESLATCPRLLERSRLISVAGTAPYAVTADVYAPGADDGPTKVLHEQHIILSEENAPLLRFALAKQLWVTLDDLRDEPLILSDWHEHVGRSS
ncbi:hypothetical protein HII36_50810 [Nonomuraea sp. NN258]|uniref:hypothetical protein n=1 Tax=Nonomuraea antri TaxID=2730852 RepID=UPI001568C107|nr:hypothetical protein [Nonomuraea antri]NRQ40064.1 hypothetical protein [Nonomuraea antri]